MKRFLILAVLVLFGVSTSVVKADIAMTFEEFVGFNDSPISTFYSGVSFTAVGTGDEWIASEASYYNTSSWPSGTSYGSGYYWMYDDVFAWNGISTGAGKIEFDSANATYVELGYCAASDFYLEAYRADGVMIDSDSGAANRRYLESNESGPGTLRVDWDGTDHIAYVIVHDTGNYWCVDNVMTDATDIVVPVPGAFLLGVLGLSVAGVKLRKRKSA
ncbi:MAG: hypothetical protein ACYSWO_04120 [Planctomycetota bacterium]|jgi:hypothetical protein